MEGYLMKWTNYLSGWKTRFFVLRNSVLYYYYEKNAQAKGRIFLGLSVITSEDDSLMIELDTGSGVIFIKGADKEEKDKWLQAMKLGKLAGENQLKSSNTMNNDNAMTPAKQFAIQRLIDFNQTMKKYIEQSMDLNANRDLVSIVNQYDKEIQGLSSKSEDDNMISPLYIREKEGEDIIFSVKNKAKGNNKFINENNGNGVNYKYNNNSNNGFNGNTNATTYKNINNDIDEDNNLLLDSYRTKEDEVFFYVDEEENTSTQDIQISTNTSPSLIQNLIREKDNNKKVFYDPLYNHQRRTSLPVARKPFSINIWSIVKGAVGKDVNRFCVPVFFNEPLSMLQKLAENFQYASILNQAAIEPNKYMRLALCATFCVAGFAMNVNRATKFFNPLLFETYEYIDNELDYRYFGEQVSHHPAISACYVEGKGWTYYTNNNAICKFLISGKLEVNNIGRCYASFTNFNDNIVFTKPLCVVRNLIFGKLTLDMLGKYYAKNALGDICEMEIIPSTSGVQGNLHGTVKDIYGNVMMKIEGNWLDSIRVIEVKTNESKELWRIIPSAGYENYYLQPYSFDLNHMTDELRKALPRTDSRFRSDQEMVEHQLMDEAGEEKHRLEEKQRKKRYENQKNNVIVKPMYFDETYDDLTGELIFRYKGNYFTDRKNGKLEHFPDIF